MGFFSFKRNKTAEELRTPVEMYLDHLNRIFKQEPEFFTNESTIPGLPGVTGIVYKDVPEKGFVTGLTYGLSLVQHPKWKFGRPELCITVKSEDFNWGKVAAFLANKFRGDCQFAYVNAVKFGEKINPESEMDAFFVFAPSILDNADYLKIDVGMNYKISIAGLYPMYSDELEAFHKLGLEAFWNHPDFDLYNVNRKRITG